jgi:fructan beta-fructosidase
VADGRRIWIGWLVNWEYAVKVPTHPWRSAQSIPRMVSLKRFPEGIRMVQSPVKELRTLRENHASLHGQSISAANRALNSKRARGDTLEILAEIDGGNAAEAGLRVRKGIDEGTTIGVDWGKREVFVDRTRSGDTAFDERFAGRHVGPIRLTVGKQVKLHIFVDRSSVEVFANDGSTVISDCIFPSRDSKELELYSKNGEARIVKLDVWNLRSAWR